MEQQVSDAAVRDMVTALTDFGYPVDFTYCRKAVDDLLAGESPLGGPQGFIRRWLKDAKLLSQN